MSDAELDDYTQKVDSWDSVSIGAGRNKVWLVDRKAGPAHFANHSCNPNAEAFEDGLIGRRDVAPGDEITVDYAPLSRKGWFMRCDCGSQTFVASFKAGASRADAARRHRDERRSHAWPGS